MCAVAASLPILRGFIRSLSIIKNEFLGPAVLEISKGQNLECWNRGKKSREQARSGALAASGVCFAHRAYPYLVRIQKILIEKIRKSVSDCCLLSSLTSMLWPVIGEVRAAVPVPIHEHSSADGDQITRRPQNYFFLAMVAAGCRVKRCVMPANHNVLSLK